MRLQFITCKVMQREAFFCAARCGNIIDVVFMPQGLHQTPDRLRGEIQKALDCTKDRQGVPYDASVLGYGLCSNGILGVSASIPIVVPRGHDCVTLLLGSRERYRQYFDSHRGVYWYSPGWIEYGDPPGRERCERLLKEYRQKYGEDNAAYLMETEQGWMKEYSRAVYIDWGFSGCEHYRTYAKDCAAFLGWKYDELKGDSSLMQRLLDGKWDESDFLIVRPGQSIAEDLTCDGIITAQCRQSHSL